MNTERAKGALSKARGQVEEGLGKVSGDKDLQARGKVRQVQDAVREFSDKA